jgi:hypothetical protein
MSATSYTPKAAPKASGSRSQLAHAWNRPSTPEAASVANTAAAPMARPHRMVLSVHGYPKAPKPTAVVRQHRRTSQVIAMVAVIFSCLDISRDPDVSDNGGAGCPRRDPVDDPFPDHDHRGMGPP